MSLKDIERTELVKLYLAKSTDTLDDARLNQSQKRWNVGVQLLWYPLLHHRSGELAQMLDAIHAAAEGNG